MKFYICSLPVWKEEKFHTVATIFIKQTLYPMSNILMSNISLLTLWPYKYCIYLTVYLAKLLITEFRQDSFDLSKCTSLHHFNMPIRMLFVVNKNNSIAQAQSIYVVLTFSSKKFLNENYGIILSICLPSIHNPSNSLANLYKNRNPNYSMFIPFHEKYYHNVNRPFLTGRNV
jgi:hypothetical protein